MPHLGRHPPPERHGDHLTSLNIATILRDLSATGVRYVLTGSAAAAAYGVPVEPRHLDIAPDLEPENLARLAEVLRRWGAKPVPDPDWPESLSPEECERWIPDPPTSEHLDHLLTTPHGLVDVVPTRSVAYADLIRRAIPMVFEEWTILVAHHRRSHRPAARAQGQAPGAAAAPERDS